MLRQDLQLGPLSDLSTQHSLTAEDVDFVLGGSDEREAGMRTDALLLCVYQPRRPRSLVPILNRSFPCLDSGDVTPLRKR